jgi:hypothetical protein
MGDSIRFYRFTQRARSDYGNPRGQSHPASAPPARWRAAPTLCATSLNDGRAAASTRMQAQSSSHTSSSSHVAGRGGKAGGVARSGSRTCERSREPLAGLSTAHGKSFGFDGRWTYDAQPFEDAALVEEVHAFAVELPTRAKSVSQHMSE